MAFAAVCALLAGWQAERSFEKAATETQQTVARPINDLIQAGVPAPQGAVGSLVSADLMLDYQNTFIVAGRVQKDGTHGFWLVANSRDLSGNLLISTLGFSTDLAKVQAAQQVLASSMQIQAFQTFEGLLMPSEAPVLSDPASEPVFSTLSLGQLYNLIDLPADSAMTGAAPKIYPLFFLVTKPSPLADGLEPIVIAPASTEVQLNLLSAFYALEWTIFCGFAFFLWWRLVRDAQLLENGEIPAVKK